MRYKIGLVKTLFHRAKLICSPELLQREEEILIKTLKENDFPEWFILKHKDRRTSEIYFGQKKKEIFIKVPFRGDINFKIATTSIRESIQKTFAAVEVNVVANTRPVLVPRLKDRLAPSSQSHVIYSFSCNCGASYIGKTERRLDCRIKEHVPKWLESSTNPPRGGTTTSSITRHLRGCQHKSQGRRNFKTVVQCSNPMKLAIYEALFIQTHKPSLCVHREFDYVLRLPF